MFNACVAGDTFTLGDVTPFSVIAGVVARVDACVVVALVNPGQCLGCFLAFLVDTTERVRRSLSAKNTKSTPGI